MQKLITIAKLPFIRELLGGIGGAMIALIVYGAYEFVADSIA